MKKSFVNHPCAVWLRRSVGNYIWLYTLFCKLSDEYTYRYGKVHGSDRRLREILNYIPEGLPTGNLTPFVQAMPKELKMSNPIKGYHRYYCTSKRHLASWLKRPTPWFYK